LPEVFKRAELLGQRDNRRFVLIHQTQVDEVHPFDKQRA
jgi:hypothetical protein